MQTSSRFFLLPLLLCQGVAAVPLPITRTFDDGQADGWAPMNLTGDSLELLSIEDCPPGEDTPPPPPSSAGLLSFYDMDAGDWGFVNTTDFAGDLSAAFGGTLSFTQRWSTLTPGPDPTDNFAANVVFGGRTNDGKNIAIAHFNPVILTRDDQHDFSQPLDSRGGWFWIDESTPFAPPNDLTPATDEQIRKVLSNVTFLYILGEFFTGDDRGYLDNVSITAPSCMSLNLTGRPDHSMELHVTGAATGERVVIQASDNLVNWEEIHSTVSTGNVIDFVDHDAPSHPRRFYRAGPGT